MSADGGSEGPRTVLVGLAVMAAVSLLIGGVVSVVALGAAGVSGLGDERSDSPDAAPTLVIPSYVPTDEVPQDPFGPPEATRQRGARVVPLDPGASESPAADGEITLFASPTQVSPSERINLDGLYLDGDGVTLQVQRQEGGTWVDFPVTANVSGGGFATWISTGRTGEQVFRVVDPTTDRVSNPVTVTVG